jgi:hypothetical protein
MKKLIAAALMAASTLACATQERPPQPKDEWNGNDKAMHFGVSFVIGYATANQWPKEPLKAWAVALIPGVLKEATDQKASGKDMAANALGAALGVATGRWMVMRNNGTTVVAYRQEF